ncbi:MAG TPA: NAD-dependent epimerase/dehydratase family protein [Thermoanaerobaculia bacterium]|nr:NAD-dependent epimerase/dehydratase family protein [Thermoanaerobaculia bacterium]
MTKTSLVTVASSLLGTLLVETLARRGEPVRALTFRQEGPQRCEEVPGCEVIYSDFGFSTEIDRAMAGVDTVYHLTALQRGWRRDWERSVLAPTLERTRRVLEAAARHGVRRVVLAGTYITTDYMGRSPLSAESWNPAPANYYDLTRTRTEQLAWEIARARGLEMVSLLPTRMIGPYAYRGKLTASIHLLSSILWNRPLYPVDFNFHYSFVPVQAVADAALAASGRGIPGRRYLLLNERFLSTGELYEMAKDYNPRARSPWRPSKATLIRLARANELLAWVTGVEPLLFVPMIERLYGFVPEVDCGEAREALGFVPGDPEAVVREVFAFLAARRAAA